MDPEKPYEISRHEDEANDLSIGLQRSLRIDSTSRSFSIRPEAVLSMRCMAVFLNT
jgi:hypothetical protein